MARAIGRVITGDDLFAGIDGDAMGASGECFRGFCLVVPESGPGPEQDVAGICAGGYDPPRGAVAHRFIKRQHFDEPRGGILRNDQRKDRADTLSADAQAVAGSEPLVGIFIH